MWFPRYIPARRMVFATVPLTVLILFQDETKGELKVG
jgi:hypothetical protein